MAVQHKIHHNDVETDRHTYIGASEIGAIMEVCPFKTKRRLWLEKRQEIEPENLSEKQHIRLAKLLEAPIATFFEEETGLKIRRAPCVYTHKQYPYIKAHPDRIIESSRVGLECKNTGEYNKDKWNGEDIPESYILQCQLCMGLSGRTSWWIAVLIGGNKYKYKEIHFDKALYDELIEKAVKFWYDVQNNIKPPATAGDDDTLKEMYPSDNGDIIDLSQADEAVIVDFNTMVAHHQELKTHKTELEKEIKEFDVKLKDLIQESTGIKTEKYMVTWKRQSKTEIDSTKLKEDGIYDNYTRVNSFRVLRVNAAKEVA